MTASSLARSRRPLLCAVALGVTVACHRPPLLPPDAAAKVGSSAVRYDEFEAFLVRTTGRSGGTLGAPVLSQIFDQFLEERLLVELAQAEGVAAPGSEPRLAIDALLKTQAAEAEQQGVDEREIAAYYAAHREEFSRPERVGLRQILAADRQTAERARAAIVERGEDFAEVARRLSQDAATGAGGYQGELAQSELPPAFADIVFRLKPQEVSPVVPADYGFHLFQVTRRLPAEVVPLPEARAEILARIRRRRLDGALARLVEVGRNRYDVIVYERNLPFDYEGSYRNAQTKP